MDAAALMRWEIYTEDGIFLALRYDYPSAMRCAQEFDNRWYQGTTVVPDDWPLWSAARTIAAPRRTDQLLRHLIDLIGH